MSLGQHTLTLKIDLQEVELLVRGGSSTEEDTGLQCSHPKISSLKSFELGHPKKVSFQIEVIDKSLVASYTEKGEKPPQLRQGPVRDSNSSSPLNLEGQSIGTATEMQSADTGVSRVAS